MSKQKTISKFEKIKTDLLSSADLLDDTFEQCKCCDARKFTSKKESLLKVDLKRIIAKIDREIKELSN